MIFMSILLAIVFYIALAVGFVRYVWRRTGKKTHLWLAIAFVILLPTWDAVLGYIVYYPACLFIPKTAIYETAETEGIYYEGDYKNYIRDSSGVAGPDRLRLLYADEDFKKGYKYVESLVTEFAEYPKGYSQRKQTSPALYRCSQLPIDVNKPHYIPMNCSPAGNMQSTYMVKSTIIALGGAEIRFVKVYDRSKGRLMAEHREVARRLTDLPFFTWVKWWDGVLPVVSCPEISRYYDFQYDVLKVKK